MTDPITGPFGDPLWSLCLAGLHLVTPANLWHSWSLAPAVTAPLIILLLATLRGYARMGDSGALPTATTDRTRWRQRRAWFVAGWLVLAVALVTPLCRLAATLVSAHMVQLMLLAGPGAALLAWGRPGRALLAAVPSRWLPARLAAPQAAGGARAVGAATVAYGAAIWLWHAPPVYHAILTNALWHWLAFVALIGASLAFWSRILAALRHNAAGAVGALLITMIHTGLLGALLTFSPRVLYPVTAPGAAAWGFLPLHDQQLAGLIMWIGGGVFYLVAALLLCTLWLRALGAQSAAPSRV
jgi:putative membrane protein